MHATSSELRLSERSQTGVKLEGPTGYEPPQLRHIGNTHELLAMAKSIFCDSADEQPGNFAQGADECF